MLKHMTNQTITPAGIKQINTLFSGVLTNIIVSILILLIGFIIGKVIGRLLQRVLKEIKVDKVLKSAGIKFSMEHFISALVTYIIYFIAIIMALNQLGITTAVLNIISGGLIILIIISILMAIKNFVPNMAAGIFIYQKGIIKEGDTIMFDKIHAKVIKTTIVETKLEGKNKDIIYIPNSLLIKKVIKIKK